MNSRIRLRIAILCAAVLLYPVAVSLARADEPRSASELTWKLKAGQRFKIEIDQDMKQSFDVAGVAQEATMKFVMYLSWQVNDANDKEFKITQTIERISLTGSMPGMGDLEYDSASDKAPEGMAATFATSMKPLVGLKIEQTLNRRGQATKVDIDSKVLDGLKNSGMGGQFTSEEMLKNLVSQAACVLPESAVEKGASWDDKFSVDNQMGKMITSSKYTYDGIETVDGKKLEKILVNSSVAIEPAEDAAVEVEISKQDNKGTVYFDNDSGYVASAIGNQLMTMKVMTMGQEINVVTSGTLTFTMTPDDGSADKEPAAEKSEDKVDEKAKESANKDK